MDLICIGLDFNMHAFSHGASQLRHEKFFSSLFPAPTGLSNLSERIMSHGFTPPGHILPHMLLSQRRQRDTSSIDIEVSYFIVSFLAFSIYGISIIE